MIKHNLVAAAAVFLVSAMATPALAACVTNSNGDVFCYTTLPPMPPPKLEKMTVDLPPPPGHTWECPILEEGNKKCEAVASANPSTEPVEPVPVQGTTVPFPCAPKGSGDPLKGLGIPSDGGPKTPCPTAQ